VVEELKSVLEEEAANRNLPTVDVLDPMMKAIFKLTGYEPRREPGLLHKLDDDYSRREPGLLHKLDDDYFRKIEAVEFAVKYDDGKDPRGILYADIVLLGVSRTSKTPLCMYLAHKRLKAANIPLVPEVNPPEELFNLPRGKVIGLTIKPQKLNEIRQERLKTLGLVSNADYASMERILKELDYAENIMKRLGCPIIDVSNKAVEETASRILQIYYRGDSSVK
jgi:regulator of PEP synthase PpsR (kinase-PPPase family)